MSTFSNNLKTLRKLNSVSQKKLAQVLGISENSYQRYEYSTREPDIDTIKKIAEYFEISIDFLMGHGIFSNWNTITMYQNEILHAISDWYPSLTQKIPAPWGTMELIRLLPITLHSININEDTNTITISPLFEEANVIIKGDSR